MLVELIPQSALEENVRAAAAILHSEGSYPSVFSGSRGTRLDNYTDGLMINTAYASSGSWFYDALQATRVAVSGSTNPMESLYQYFYNDELASSDVYIATYGRYWHGYLVFLRPLLVVAGYPSIRSVNMVLQIAVVFGLLYVLVRRHRSGLCVPVLVMWAALSPATLFYSLQYSTVFYPTICVCIALVLLYDRVGIIGRCVIFELAGIAVAYFDLLTYPLVSLGVPLVLLISLEYGHWGSLKEAVANVAPLCASWAVGYGGMWVSKWLIATALTDVDVIASALSQMSHRVSADNDAGDTDVYTPLGVIKDRLWYLFSAGFVLAFVLAAVIGCIVVMRRGLPHLNVPATAAFGVACLLPFLWFIVVLNHSGVHQFTYRELAIMVYAIMSFLWVQVGPERVASPALGEHGSAEAGESKSDLVAESAQMPLTRGDGE